MDKDTLMLSLTFCMNNNPNRQEPCSGCPLEYESLCKYKLFNEVAKYVYSSNEVKILVPEKE